MSTSVRDLPDTQERSTSMIFKEKRPGLIPAEQHLKEDDEARDVFGVFLGIIPEGALPAPFPETCGSWYFNSLGGSSSHFLVFLGNCFLGEAKTRCQKIQ